MKVLVNLSLGSSSGWLHRSRVFGVAIKAILEATVLINLIYLRLHSVPPLYRCGVRYQEEPDDGMEEFATIPIIISRGWGDCDDLAPWRVAELRHTGEDKKAGIRISWERQKNSRKLFHITVRRGNGTIEDPSRILGMGT